MVKAAEENQVRLIRKPEYTTCTDYRVHKEDPHGEKAQGCSSLSPSRVPSAKEGRGEKALQRAPAALTPSRPSGTPSTRTMRTRRRGWRRSMPGSGRKPTPSACSAEAPARAKAAKEAACEEIKRYQMQLAAVSQAGVTNGN